MCGAYHLYLLWATHEDVIYQFGNEVTPNKDGGDQPNGVDMVLALRSSLSFGELCIYTCLASGGVLLYLAFLIYAWIMVKVLRDQLRESTNGTAFVMKIVKQL